MASKLVAMDIDDIGNHAVTTVSLLFTRTRLFGVNAKHVTRRERDAFTWGKLYKTPCANHPAPGFQIKRNILYGIAWTTISFQWEGCEQDKNVR